MISEPWTSPGYGARVGGVGDGDGDGGAGSPSAESPNSGSGDGRREARRPDDEDLVPGLGSQVPDVLQQRRQHAVGPQAVGAGPRRLAGHEHAVAAELLDRDRDLRALQVPVGQQRDQLALDLEGGEAGRLHPADEGIDHEPLGVHGELAGEAGLVEDDDVQDVARADLVFLGGRRHDQRSNDHQGRQMSAAHGVTVSPAQARLVNRE